MNDNPPQIDQLLAYVDGQLNAKENQEIELLLQTDEEARQLVEQFKTSNLPYEEAFEHLLKSTSIEEKTIKQSNFIFGSWGALAASLILGVAIGLLGAQYSPQQKSWVQQVVDYQILYGRETIENVQLSAYDKQQLEMKLGEILGHEFKVPQLKEHGLDFKRGQILTLDNKPLIQLVYLPQQGKPVALCIMKLNQLDQNFSLKNYMQLSSIEWTKNNLSYVLVGDMPDEALRQAAVKVKKMSI